ncbi:MAG: DNA gyrase subunit B [Firmicutes bacterium]|nr:DNA gyrase subunit B [Bacillota bacterium]MCL2771210.1 DNA gyrase subunit B [Bacillota bacterium]
MAKSYEAKDLIVLEGLDAVRMRPGMYIGSTGSRGLHHLLWEIVDNSIDELANGHGTQIDVVLYQDGSASVRDDGRGIPTSIHSQYKVSGVELVFTKLHAGGKFSTDNYTHSGGLHGVGASVANALSKWLVVEVAKGGQVVQMQFHSPEVDKKIKSGLKKTELVQIAESEFNPNMKNFKKGTFVRFLPDERVFKTATFSTDTIGERLKTLAFLNKGIKITLQDLRAEEIKEPEVFHFEGGLSDFCEYLNIGKIPLFKDPIYIETKSDLCELVLAMQWTDSFTESIFSYVNSIPTTEGGTHETGLKTVITKSFNDLARKYNYLKDKDENFVGDDFREGLTAVLLVRMNNTQFEGQTKTKLGNPEIKPEVESLVGAAFEEFFATKPGQAVFDTIIKKSKNAREAREAAMKSKELARQKRSISADSLVGKLSSCTGKDATENELFIVEGDSAGGSAKQGRDRRFQAILPLRGKPLNAEKKRISQVLANEEIRSIITALGAGIGEDFDLERLKYHKVIILADADQDGAHIRAILLTFLFRYMKILITEGHVYIGMPPLYKVSKKDQIVYAYNEEELKEVTEQIGKGYNIQRYKGLGEMNPEQLWETTMNPEARKLVQVSIDDAAESEKIITTLMGDDIEVRKAYIFENANFNKTDTFDTFQK